jgi:hypothetical protein
MYFIITNIKIFNSLVNLGAIFLISLYSRDGVIIYASTLAVIAMCGSIWDAGAATLNSKIDLNENTAYRLATGEILNQGLKTTALIAALVFAFKQEGANQQITAIVCISAIIPTVYILRWGVIKRRSGCVVESIIFSETIPALTRFALVPIFIINPMSGFLIYYLLLAALAGAINKIKKIINLELFFINKTEDNGISDISKLYFSIITAVKDQLLSLFSPFMSPNVGVVMVYHQRIVGVLQIMLSGVHALLPLELKGKNFRRIRIALISTFFFWGLLTFLSNYFIEIISLTFSIAIDIELTYISWMVLWSPVFLSLVATLMIADGRTKSSSLIEILQIIAFVAVVRNF